MQHALQLARNAEIVGGEVPVGAVLVLNETIVGEGSNRTIALSDPTAHAEIQALREAGQRLNNYRFPGTTLYVTLEPCAMCAMALIHARVQRVVFAAHDPKTGVAGSVFDILISEKHNHRLEVAAGIEAETCGNLLRNFFKRKRLQSTDD